MSRRSSRARRHPVANIEGPLKPGRLYVICPTITVNGEMTDITTLLEADERVLKMNGTDTTYNGSIGGYMGDSTTAMEYLRLIRALAGAGLKFEEQEP